MRLGFAGIIAVAGFLLIPALEIVGIYQIGSRIGVGWTLVWLLSALFLGGAVIGRERAAFMPRLQQAMARGQTPFALLWVSGRRFLAGVLLILPGAASDLIALLLLLWPGPKAAGSRPDWPNRPNSPGRATPDAEVIEGEVIEGDYRRED
ncbi:MAG: hypothetical protein B7Y41_05240 [Hydrogenophilales bacterium 28-61-23]|nr:MAG: hypothetical protein B7Y41_05240 [Hydrogenophilales bacterium 28-61-23]